VGLGRSGHPAYCPVVALTNRVRHLRTHNAPLTTPLYAYYHTKWNRIATTTLTTQLRHAVTAMGHTYGIAPTNISVWSLRSSGAMSLLCAKVDTDMIRLLGRWRRDEMLRYLLRIATGIQNEYQSQSQSSPASGLGLRLRLIFPRSLVQACT
jgi:hypothetical protein